MLGGQTEKQRTTGSKMIDDRLMKQKVYFVTVSVPNCSVRTRLTGGVKIVTRF
jgi:hypothetical protein